MNEDLTTFIEPELEARIVALVLGEASAFEQEELERIIADRPEARLFKNRIAELHGLVDEASNPVDAIAWKLSSDRRETVLAKIREEQPVVASLPAKKPANQFRRRLVFYGAAACFVAVVAGLATPAVLKSEKSSVQTANLSEGVDLQGGSEFKMEVPLPPARGLILEPKATDLGSALEKNYAEGEVPWDFEFTGNGRQEGKKSGASASDLLASINGDYSLEVPTAEKDSKSDVTRERQPQLRATTLSVSGKVNTRDGGIQKDQTAFLSSGQRIAVPATAFAGKSGVSNGQTTNVEYRDVTFDGFVDYGNKAEADRLAEVPAMDDLPAVGRLFASATPAEPSTKPTAATATAGVSLNRKIETLAANGVVVTGVADSEGLSESLAGQIQPGENGFGWVDGSEVSDSKEFVAPPASSSVLNRVIVTNDAIPVPKPPSEMYFGDGWGAEPSGATSNFFLGGGSVGADSERTSADFIGTVDRVQIPGIPASPEQAVSGIVTAGNRSGSASVNRNSIDAILNDSEKPSGGVTGFPVTPATPTERGRGASGLLGNDKDSIVEYDSPELPAPRGSVVEAVEQSKRLNLNESIALEDQGDSDPFGGGGGGGAGGADPFAAPTDRFGEEMVEEESLHRQAGDQDSQESLAGKSIRVQTKFVDVEQENIEELGFDMALGDFDSSGEVHATSSGDLEQQESIRRQLDVGVSDELRDKGRKAYAEGDYETATRHYRASLETLPSGTATADRREVINDHLQDGSLALSQTYRRTGRYEEARNLLTQVDKADPGNELARKGLEYLDDPIKTSPALSYEHTKNIDKVRRELYTGEGHYDLGQYDKAEEHFKEVLRTDPYNKAARRWLEKTSAVKSDYFRAAYDQTRAEMLTEVDAAWELKDAPVANESMAKVEGRDFDLDGIALSEEDSEKLQKLGDEVQEKRKELTVQIQEYGIPYFDGRDSNPIGATEEEMYRHAQRSLDDFESDREVLAQELQKVREEKTENSDQIEDVLKSKLSLLDRQVDKMREVVDNKQDVTVELSLKQHNYNQTKEDYSQALDEFRELKKEIAAKTAPAREFQRKKRAVLAELDEAIPSDDGIVWSSEDSVPFDRVFRREVSQKPAVDGELSRASIESIPLYDSATTWDEKSQATANKLNEIVLPELDLSNVTVEEAMAIIKEKAKEADLGEVDEFARGVDLHVRTPRVVDEDGLDDSGLGGGGDPNQILIKKLNLRNVPLRVALQYVADAAKLRYKVDDAGVTLLPAGADDTADIVQRRFVVPDTFETFLSDAGGGAESGEADPFAGGDDSGASGVKPRMSIIELLKNTGVSFPPNASASFLKDSNTLIVRSTPTNLDLIDGIVKAAGIESEKTEEIKKQKQIELDTFETSTAQKTDSTFSLNVSDVSFKLAKSSLANGQWPEADKVRPEEFVNALSYGDNTPTQAEKVACVIEQGSHPFMQQRNLMRVSMSTAALGRNASTPLRLTVLLDQSGSMERADRAESVRRAFALLTSQLNAHDEITLVGFARTPRLLAERVKGNESGKLAEIVGNPLTEGGTNLEAALSSGLQLAKQQFVEGAQNRIILLTDGAANLGDALPENLARQVARMRDAGIAFDACGVGADGLNDEVLTSLAKQGDGRYYFLDRPEDADEGFARQIAGALRPAAKNVKVQVIFNPERVSNFKLYGFEKHQLKKEDFRNDAVDAAEMAAEESGVALYHFQPLPEGRGDIGTVSVRFLDTATDQMVERTWTIPYQPDATSFSDANPALRLASVAGLFAERLKGSPVGERVELKRLRQETELLKPVFRNQARFQEFQTMLQQAGE